jgi:hypothetical protein
VPHSCAIQDGALECWGDEEFGNNGVHKGRYSAVSCGSWHTCALDQGSLAYMRTHADACAPTNARAPDLCAHAHSPSSTVRAESNAGCLAWAQTPKSQPPNPKPRSSAESHAKCFGAGYALQTTVPKMSFSALSAGFSDTCGIATADASLVCWGAKVHPTHTP